MPDFTTNYTALTNTHTHAPAWSISNSHTHTHSAMIHTQRDLDVHVHKTTHFSSSLCQSPVTQLSLSSPSLSAIEARTRSTIKRRSYAAVSYTTQEKGASRGPGGVCASCLCVGENVIYAKGAQNSSQRQTENVAASCTQ